MKRTIRLKSILALLLACMLLFMLIPVGALAEGESNENTPSPSTSPAQAEQQSETTPTPTAETSSQQQSTVTNTPIPSSTPGSTVEATTSSNTPAPAENIVPASTTGSSDNKSPASKEDEAVALSDGETTGADGTQETDVASTVQPSNDNSVVSVSGTITWENESAGVTRPTLTIYLLQNGSAIQKYMTKGTSYAFNSLPAADAQGQAYSYRISVPKTLGNYTVSCTGNNVKAVYSAPAAAAPANASVSSDAGASTGTGTDTDSAGAQTSAPQTQDVTVDLSWNGVPEGATPKAVVKLASSNPAADGQQTSPVSAGTTSVVAGNYAIYDESGTAYTYAVASASADVIDGYALKVTTSELSVSITYMAQAVLDALVAEIIADIDALPTAEALGNMTLRSEEHMNTATAYMNVSRKLYALSEEQKALITNLEKFNAIPRNYIMSAMLRSMVQTVNVPFTLIWDVTDVTSIPDNLSFSLFRDGSSFGAPITLNKTSFSGKAWTGTFTGLDKSKVNGTLYHYTIAWPTATGFIIAGGETSATYHAAAPTSYTVKVSWSGEPVVNCPTRPTEMNIGLTNAIGAPTATIKASEGWSHTFTSVTVATAGAPIGVQVTAGAPSQYTASFSTDAAGVLWINFHYTAGNINISGNIVWPSVLPTGITKPATVDVTLIQSDPNGNHYQVDTIRVNTATENKFVFTGYPQYDSYGRELYYSVVECCPTNFTASYSGSYNNVTITNHLNTATEVNLRVTVRWNDNHNSRAYRPIETTVYLYRDGVATGYELQVRYADQWTNVFANLPRTDGYGHYYNYSVRAAKIPHYYANPVYANRGSAVTLTYVYGTASTAEKTETTTVTAPLVGDILLTGARLSKQERVELAKEGQRAKVVYDQVATAVREAQTSGDIDFTSLKKTNGDVTAWLTSDGTEINYPIMRGSDNSYYLNHLISKEKNRSGALFMDSDCNKLFTSRNTVIYGHHMSDGSMFASLLSYKKQDYYAAHPTMKLYTPQGNYTLEIFAAFTTGDEKSAVARLKFNGNTDFMEYINACTKKSDFNTSVDVGAGDNIVTFVTCSYDYDNTRYLVMGRLKPA